jgi:hypothetical protein
VGVRQRGSKYFGEVGREGSCFFIVGYIPGAILSTNGRDISCWTFEVPGGFSYRVVVCR